MKRMIFTTWILYVMCGCSAQQPGKQVNGLKVGEGGYNKAYINSLKDQIRKNKYKQINSIVAASVRANESQNTSPAVSSYVACKL